jgi:hypothetical protein
MLAAAAVFVLGGAVATAAELPTYELLGFPISPHQFSVVGSANIKEWSPIASLTLGGMPASPHQLAVLTPRPGMTEQQVADKLTQAGFSQVRFVLPTEYTVMALRNGEWTKLTINTRTGGLR